jgi:hypothetical protein
MVGEKLVRRSSGIALDNKINEDQNCIDLIVQKVFGFHKFTDSKFMWLVLISFNHTAPFYLVPVRCGAGGVLGN